MKLFILSLFFISLELFASIPRIDTIGIIEWEFNKSYNDLHPIQRNYLTSAFSVNTRHASKILQHVAYINKQSKTNIKPVAINITQSAIHDIDKTSSNRLTTMLEKNSDVLFIASAGNEGKDLTKLKNQWPQSMAARTLKNVIFIGAALAGSDNLEESKNNPYIIIGNHSKTKIQAYCTSCRSTSTASIAYGSMQMLIQHHLLKRNANFDVATTISIAHSLMKERYIINSLGEKYLAKTFSLKQMNKDILKYLTQN